ncbi:MAG: nicotinate phosphoribosyltransferase [Acidobacteria bacterium]|nr:nicotinate phosphoribosyltransferase [Acidobacteriota bacterium]MBV9476842.1 nicotinate phosphoribosyltransferase [Acidobacteriota bacterium]
MTSRALLTDLYQLTMAYGWFRIGRADDEAVFHLLFRNAPFGGGYAIAAGLEDAIRYLEELRFDADDLGYLATLRGNDDAPLFPDDFLRFLGELRFDCDVDAVPEGTVVFAQEPLVRVRGRLPVAQIVETALLNIINFQTLIATKAARVVHAAEGDPVIDFGLRRAQGENGALSAARAAYIGGVGSTSNVLAGARYGLPVRGTHAHSWVLSFDSEQDAFAAYADVLPNNALLLVDTYDTLDGVRHAIDVGRRLRERGHELSGIRLDSGDLAYLSIEARKLLDDAGFPNAVIAASNDLDEQTIASLKQQRARITVWGVGTRLITAYDQPALGGVYKLGALRRAGGAWEHRLKLSEQTAKVSTPGVLQVRRFTRDGEAAGDMIWDELTGARTRTIVDPFDLTRRKSFDSDGEDLLVPVFRNGQRVYDLPPLDEVRARRERDLARFHEGIKRLVNPHRYPVGLEQSLFDLKTRLVLAARAASAAR